jgi:hypothetical protein
MAAAAVPVTMNAYLQVTLRITNNNMREKIIAEGYESMDVLVKKDKDWVKNLRLAIKWSSTGNAASREVTLKHEESLVKTMLWAKMKYLTQYPLSYTDATVDSITEVYDWYNAQEEELSIDTVSTFSPTLNRRDWFESIQSYLAAKKGQAGVPLTYVILTTGVIDPAARDLGFGAPSSDDDLARRGRHDGHFLRPNNNVVWRLLEQKCRGTDAWTTIAGFERTKNGYQAYLALSNLYMGEDVQQILRTKADTILKHSRYDGRPKNYTLDKHINRFKQAFIDLGPNDVTSEPQKVELFMNSWQVSSMMHLASTVCQSPTMKNNFNATCNFLAGEVASLQTLNTSTTGANRSVAAVSTQPNPKSKFNTKSSGKSKDNPKKGKPNKGKFPKKAKKFNKDNPGAYVTAAVWKSMSKDEQQAARDQRRDQGSPTRNVSTITTNQKTTTFAETVEGRHYNTDQPPASVAKNTTIQVATLAQLQPTQKPKVYKGQATAQSQMDPQAEIELLKQQLAELSSI